MAHFSALVIFLNLLDMAVSVNPADVARVAHRRGLVLRAVLAVIVLVPMFALTLSYLEAIPWPTRVALALLACSPGAPLASRRAAGLGTPLATAMGLQLILAVVGSLSAPLMLVLMARMHGIEEGIPVLEGLWQVFSVQALPLALGLLVAPRYPAAVARWSPLLRKLANLSMLLLVGLGLVGVAEALPVLTPATGLALAAFTSFSLAVGHLLGGPSRETRTAVAVASANRNLGLAIMLGTSVSAHPQKLILLFAVVSFLVGSAYGRLALSRGDRGSGAP